MARIKKERIQAYEGKLDNREIEVYNHDSMVKLQQQKKAQEFWQNEKDKQEEMKEQDGSMQIDTTTKSKPVPKEDDDDNRIERNAAIRLI